MELNFVHLLTYSYKMKLQRFIKLFLILVFILQLISCKNDDANLQFISKLSKDIKRTWINENFWANRLQDWQLNNGRIECINAEFPLRTVHILPYTISRDSGQIHIEIELGTLQQNDSLEVTDFAGVLIGVGSMDDNFKKRAIISGQNKKNNGIIVAINGKGKIIYMNNDNKTELLNLAAAEEIGNPQLSKNGLLVYIDIFPEANKYSINTSIIDKKNEKIISYAKIINLEKNIIQGNIALIANGAKDNNKGSFWFKNLVLKGNKLIYNKNNTIGPIIGTVYSVFENKLKLTAQFMPISKTDNKLVILEMSDYKKENWKEYSKVQIDTLSYTAKFETQIPNSNAIYNYRIVYNQKDANGKSKKIEFLGIISNNKNQQNIIKLAIFKNNSFLNNSINLENFDITLPNEKFTTAIKKSNPDLLLFMGNQINTNNQEPADFSNFKNLRLDYLNKWYLWYLAYGEFTSNNPSMILPSNNDFCVHDTIDDVKIELSKRLNKKDLSNFIKLVNTTQFTEEDHQAKDFESFNFGNISFALINNKLEAKNEADQLQPIFQINENLIDSFEIRKLDFLTNWSTDWTSADMKAIITQYPISQIDIPKEAISYLQKKENHTIRIAQKTQSVIITSATSSSFLYKYGLKNFGDASYSYISPQLYSWDKMHKQKIEYINSNNEKIQILAKPEEDSLKLPNDISLSFGMVSFNKFQKSISFENFNCNIDTLQGESKNWRETVLNKNNFQENSPSFLPQLEIKGLTTMPIISVYDGLTKELIYSKRIKSMNYKPQVYYWGKYDIEIKDTFTGKVKRFDGIYAKNINDQTSIIVKF